MGQARGEAALGGIGGPGEDAGANSGTRDFRKDRVAGQLPDEHFPGT